jgi:hypothetical protein
MSDPKGSDPGTQTPPHLHELLQEQIADMQERLQGIAADVDGMQERLDMMDTLAAEVRQQNGQHAPDKSQPLNNQYQPGDDVELIVEDDGANTKHNDPMGRVDGAVTFLKTGDRDDLSNGDVVQATLTQVDDRHMRAVVREVEDGGSA